MKYNKLALSLQLLSISLSNKRPRPVPIMAFTSPPPQMLKYDLEEESCRLLKEAYTLYIKLVT